MRHAAGITGTGLQFPRAISGLEETLDLGYQFM